jgi:5-hydroxyisourate hydrolase
MTSIVRGASRSQRALKWRSPTRIDRSLIGGGYPVAAGRPTISTHVLDTATGLPARGVRVRLARVDGGAERAVGEGVTDDDGRIHDLLGGAALEAGSYRLTFDLGEQRFFQAAALDVRIDDAARGYHVPLLVAPYGLSSYRGS